MGAAGFRLPALALLTAACTSIAADARTFEGTRWQVSTINGRATPPTGDYRIQFKDGGIGGRFGCNHFGGRYAISRNLLVARDIASTLMGCAEPAMSFESAGLKVLAQPMQMTWISDRRLTLANTAGAIQLERLP